MQSQYDAIAMMVKTIILWLHQVMADRNFVRTAI
jgi:hypothetical protein